MPSTLTDYRGSQSPAVEPASQTTTQAPAGGRVLIADFLRWLRPFAFRHRDILTAAAVIAAVIFITALAIQPRLWPFSLLALAIVGAAAGAALGGLYARYRLVRFVQAQAAELASLRHLSAAVRRDYAELDLQKKELERHLQSAQAAGAKTIQRVEIALKKELSLLGEAQTSIEDRLNRVEASVQSVIRKKLADETLLRRLNNANSIEARPVVRYLAPDKRARLAEHWAPLLGVQVTPSALSYLAHKVAVAEDRCSGRLAAPAETALLRHLAMRSLGPGKLNVLEIGTLFGLAAGLLYRGATDFGADPHFTLLDPLDGYYGEGVLDPLTGMPISEKTLRANLKTLEVPDTAWRLIKHLSTEPEARQEAGDRQYDLILIDGDHTLEGVKADYELYADFVKPGGLLIFDDYDTVAWPDIKPYVDEHVLQDPRWEWLGGEYGTGILRRKM